MGVLNGQTEELILKTESSLSGISVKKKKGRQQKQRLLIRSITVQQVVSFHLPVENLWIYEYFVR